MNIQQGIQAVVDGADLAVEDAAGVMRQIMAAEATPAQFGSFVTALRDEGRNAGGDRRHGSRNAGGLAAIGPRK